MTKKTLPGLLIAITLFLVLCAAGSAETEQSTDALDYSDPANWAYFRMGEDREIDVFLIAPTVDTRSATNAFDLNEKMKSRFVNALNMEKGIYEEACRLYSPYYRQMSLNAYKLPGEEFQKAYAIAYEDVSNSFLWYLEHENQGRPLILAGFSQGAEMCLEIMKEYYGEQNNGLSENLVSVYCLGWRLTDDIIQQYPQIIPASGETDTGTVIAFDCENGSLTGTLIIPEGIWTHSINPLNWKTDGTIADRSLNHGAVMETGGEPIPALCGAYIGERGELVVTDVDVSDYPPGLDVFPEGSYHLYDYKFFFTNLKENVERRIQAFMEAREEENAA